MNNQISHLAPGSATAELLRRTVALLWLCTDVTSALLVPAAPAGARGRVGSPVPWWLEGNGLPEGGSCTRSPSGCVGRAELCQPAWPLPRETTLPPLQHPLCCLSW